MNIFDYTTPKHGEMFSTLLEHKNIRINRIVSSNDSGQIEYIQEEDEWVVVLEGKATLLLESKEKTLFKGDTLLIPARTSHKVLKTEQGTLWLTVHIY